MCLSLQPEGGGFGFRGGLTGFFIHSGINCGRQSDKTWSLVRHHLARNELLASSYKMSWVVMGSN